MRVLSIILLIILCGFKESRTGCAKLDIMLIADISGSVNGYQNYIHDALFEFANQLDLDENGIRIGLMTFNDEIKILHNLDDNKSALIKAIGTIKSSEPNGSTYLWPALDQCLDQYVRYGRGKAKWIAIIVTDGNPAQPYEVIHQAGKLKHLGVTIFGVMVQSKEENVSVLEQISSPNCYVSTNYELLSEELRKLDICL